MKRPANPQATADRIRELSRLRPTLGMVLGSGFQNLASEVLIEERIAYEKLPGFPVPRVAGHCGELLAGTVGGTPVLVLSGRSHFYEGHSMDDVTFPIRVLAALGIRDLLLTNAAGGINRVLRPGDFMVVTDHINWMGANPLRGDNGGKAVQFVDLSRTYDGALAGFLRKAARVCRIKLRSGVYVAVSGPSYETPAEIRAFAKLGGDAVGMSTVPEAIVARQCGLNVAAISCITNLAAGRSRTAISHEEVLRMGNRREFVAAQLLKNFAEIYGSEQIKPKLRLRKPPESVSCESGILE